MIICYACNRILKRSPIVVGGDPYGPTCAKTVKPSRDPLAPDLFVDIDIEAAANRAQRRVGRFIDYVARREMRAMRASWRAAA